MSRPLEHLATRQPVAVAFFEAALLQGRLAHAYVLKGPDTDAQYQVGLALAQILNCLTPVEQRGGVLAACDTCRNCKWIQDNAHPAVMTVTRLTYEAEGDTSTAKKQIRTAQMNQLLSTLSRTSDGVRVVLFADADELPANHPSAVLAPAEWRHQPGNDAKSLHLRPLNSSVFSEKAVNQFLKTLEEPHPHTLFLFLTDSEANLLPTVVSRCQVVPFGAAPVQVAGSIRTEEHTFLQQWWQQVQGLRQTREPFGVIAQFRQFWEEDQGMDLVYGLRQLQGWLQATWPQHGLSVQRYYRAQRAIMQTMEQLVSKVHGSTALWHLLQQLA